VSAEAAVYVAWIVGAVVSVLGFVVLTEARRSWVSIAAGVILLATCIIVPALIAGSVSP